MKKRGLANGSIPTSLKKGAIETVYTAPPEGSVTVCLDQMGPVAVKSYPGKRLVDPEAAESKPAERARQEIDYGRREKAGYVFGALEPRTGEVLTAPYTRRRLVNWIDFLQQVEEWIPKDVERIYAVLDNLTMHRAVDVLLFNLAYPRWEGGAKGDGLLECTQTSLCLGPTSAPSAPQKARHCTTTKSGLNLPDAPLSAQYRSCTTQRSKAKKCSTLSILQRCSAKVRKIHIM